MEVYRWKGREARFSRVPELISPDGYEWEARDKEGIKSLQTFLPNRGVEEGKSHVPVASDASEKYSATKPEPNTGIFPKKYDFDNEDDDFLGKFLPEGVAPFTHITRNERSGRKQIKKKEEEDIAVCECKFDPRHTELACGERCLNVLTNTECTPGYCPCGTFCKNQRFQKCEYTKTKLFKTEGRGWGLLADENIKAGQFIIEYCGEIISSEEAKARSQTYESQGLRDAYIISLNASYFIDATRKGSLANQIVRLESGIMVVCYGDVEMSKFKDGNHMFYYGSVTTEFATESLLRILQRKDSYGFYNGSVPTDLATEYIGYGIKSVAALQRK
ncbi:hypothetical protein LXL04_006594 [Taraxacum kok-saghyz]